MRYARKRASKIQYTDPTELLAEAEYVVRQFHQLHATGLPFDEAVSVALEAALGADTTAARKALPGAWRRTVAYNAVVDAIRSEVPHHRHRDEEFFAAREDHVEPLNPQPHKVAGIWRAPSPEPAHEPVQAAPENLEITTFAREIAAMVLRDFPDGVDREIVRLHAVEGCTARDTAWHLRMGMGLRLREQDVLERWQQIQAHVCRVVGEGA